MSRPIGFVILINPFTPLAQTERLIRKLNRMFDVPPIACHHDFSQSDRWLDNCPTNVMLVRPHVVTRWASFGCVEAAVRALDLLYRSPDAPDWWVYLSSSDYPVKGADRIVSELKESPFDAFIQHEWVRHPSVSGPGQGRWDPSGLPSRVLLGLPAEVWLRGCYQRYCSLKFTLPVLNGLRPRRKTVYVEQPVLTRPFTPFDREFRCYAGEAWFCANRKSAERIQEFHGRDRRLARHYEKVVVPEESYFHTVLANAPGLRLNQNTLRYTDWSAGGSHPKVLTLEDLPRINASAAHFARKFDPAVDPRVLDELDAIT